MCLFVDELKDMKKDYEMWFKEEKVMECKYLLVVV